MLPETEGPTFSCSTSGSPSSGDMATKGHALDQGGSCTALEQPRTHAVAQLPDNIILRGEEDDDNDDADEEVPAQRCGQSTAGMDAHDADGVHNAAQTTSASELYAGVASPEKKGKKKKRKALGICLAHCKYDSVRRCSRWFGMKEMSESDDWALFWMDWSPTMDRVGDMKQYQKINHFPGMHEICRKDMLARNMNRLCKLFPKDYAIFPRSWCMPQDYGDFLAFCRTKKNKTFIKKPDAGCQGRGISVTRNPKDITGREDCVVQQYISKPFLIDGFKFDYRVYVLITSCDPLRIFVYKDGLARFCTIKYTDPASSNVDEVCMHLTNYAINKHSADFVRDDDSGSKRRITTVDKWFIDNGYDLKKIWADMEDCIIKTLIAAQPTLKQNYRACFPTQSVRNSACFEVLGFDLMLDKKLKPWVIEVNLSPSFHTDAPLDKEVKEGLLSDALRLINLYGVDKKKILEDERKRNRDRLLNRGKPKETHQPDTRAEDEAILEAYEDANLGGYRRIFPQGNKEKYEPFFEHSGSLFTETAAFRARQECAKAQREEITAKLAEKEMWKNRLQHGGKKRTAQDAGAAQSSTAAASNMPRPESPQLARGSNILCASASTLSRPSMYSGPRSAGAALGRKSVEMRNMSLMSRSRSQMDRRVSHIALEIFDADIRERADEMATRERIVLRLDIRARCQELLDMVKAQKPYLDPGPLTHVYGAHDQQSGALYQGGRRRVVGSIAAAPNPLNSRAGSVAAAGPGRPGHVKRPPVKTQTQHHLGGSRLFNQPDRIARQQPERITADTYTLASQLQNVPPTQRLLSDGPPQPLPLARSQSHGGGSGEAVRQMTSEAVRDIGEGEAGRQWLSAGLSDVGPSPMSKYPSMRQQPYQQHERGEYRHSPTASVVQASGMPMVSVPGYPRTAFIQPPTGKPQSSIPVNQHLRGQPAFAGSFLPGNLAVNGLGLAQPATGGSSRHGQQLPVAYHSAYSYQRRSGSSLGPSYSQAPSNTS